MDDAPFTRPAQLDAIAQVASSLDFAMSSDERTGALLAVLAASKPGGHVVEIGTGLGAGTAWLLSGMDEHARLTTVEVNDLYSVAARAIFDGEDRAAFVCADAADWLDTYTGPPIDLAFVDWRIGKFERLDRLVDLLAPGGLYVVDDLLPQPTWPGDHPERIAAWWEGWPRADMAAVPLAWASGLLVAAKSNVNP